MSTSSTSALSAPSLAGRVLTFIAAALAALPLAGLAQSHTPTDQKVELLFVQNASSVSFDTDKATMRLHNVTPTTLFFTDRPVRMAGHVLTKQEFLPMWGETPDSFVKDPPNATVSIVEPGRADLQNIVVKLQKPRMDGQDLVYNIKVLNGKPPKTGGATALFIDILGFWAYRMPRVAVVEPAPLYVDPLAVPTTVTVTTTTTPQPTSSANAAQASAAAAQAEAAAAQAEAAAAQTKAATAAPAPAPAPAAQPAPALTPAEQKLAQLKSMLNQGFITQAQYNQASQAVINQMIQ
ncbi:MAG: hypothetical protein U1F98_07805 [Verrucomicrobiota bacterium]